MQSQQKRVKWSRGETAEALEERTDTGITMASVELMENCIPDIYGNISRRPALKVMDGIKENCFSFSYETQYPDFKFIPFYITEDDIILISIPVRPSPYKPEFMRIRNGVAVAKKSTSGNVYPFSGVPENGVYVAKPVSYSQQNNYMIIATETNVYKFTITTSGDDFTPTFEFFKFSAGWYAPSGTQTKQVTTNDVTGLSFSGNFSNYTYTNSVGDTNVYSMTSTGVSGNLIDTLAGVISVGSIIQLPNIGAYLRVEGYVFGSGSGVLAFEDTTFDGVLTPGATVPATGIYCQPELELGLNILNKYVNGVKQPGVYCPANTIYAVKNTASTSGYSQGYFTNNWGNWSGWTELTPSSFTVYVYGELLTPVADNAATDSIVRVEYGYVDLMPRGYTNTGTYPHPTKIAFYNQRLWAGDWKFEGDSASSYSLVIGSQIAKYNDFENNYNQENEAITLDILTQYREKITHLGDYNGLKIMTDAYEYIYEGGGATRQSANGSLPQCEPIIFEGLCVYADSTGNQIRAMQYEFQSNLFNSSSMNTFAPHDLIWNPITLASFEDKIYSTGKYLFVVNENTTNSPKLVVCNFVPSNQANIWSRWSFPNVYANQQYMNLLFNIVPTKKYPIFIVKVNSFLSFNGGTESEVEDGLIPAVLDFNGVTDLQTTLSANKRVLISHKENLTPIRTEITHTLVNAQVAVYSDGEFKFLTTTTSAGYITDDLTGLTNITVGLPINATIRSHPIDVGGKTKSIKKRIGKARMSVHDTQPGAITINGKTGYMNPAQDLIDFYGVTGMKNEIKYTITNNNGAMFHLESLLMNIEYGTLSS
ncbi:MAG: hypothetical protein J6S85_18995 [Methanobrevibacter sp.]|nr:hypothetical protein [Methanobrevibacter sp.]